MSYLVLARKWRPQVFEDVLGQRPITKTLQNAIVQQRVAHAFLFAGARGVGKTSTARILAKALNCEHGPATNPCNQCPICTEISHGTSMDVIEIDGASNRGIDEIRELRENVRYTPATARYKIYIIDEVHMLTREAFNALLKTLEEPPSHVIFIFATTEPHKIPTTILSRCQRYDFKKIPLKEIREALAHILQKEEVQVSPQGLALIARASEGSMRDAQSLLDQVIAYGGKEIKEEEIAEVLGVIDLKILHDTFEAIRQRDAGTCMEIVEQIYQYGYDLQNFCRELLQYLRNLILMKVSEHPEAWMELPEEEVSALKKQAAPFHLDQLNLFFSLLVKGGEEIAQSPFPRIMLEMTLIRMTALPSVLPIDEILKKLEELEKPSSGARSTPGDKTGERRGAVSQNDPAPGERKSPEYLRKAEDPGTPEPLTVDASSVEESVFSEDVEPQTGPEKGEALEKSGEEVWRGLLDAARTRSHVLSSFLALGRLVHLKDDQVEIGFDKGSLAYDRFVEKENRAQLDSICNEYFRKGMKVVVSPIEQTAKSNGRTSPGIEGMEEHPLVREALRMFNGRIVEK
jgi:DNA polymerase III subunit gamma/tau